MEFLQIFAEIFGNLTRNIKNIRIEEVEYKIQKISQNEDDYSLFSDGSPETMDGILRE